MTTIVKEFNSDTFANTLKKLRGDESKKSAAEKIGISDAAWGTYESSQRVPSADVIFRLAKRYNVSADYLLGLSGVKSVDLKVADICEYTGLTEEAILNLHDLKEKQDEANRTHSDSKDSRFFFSYISALLSLSFSSSYSHNVLYLDIYLSIYCRTSKEMRKLDVNLPKVEQEYLDFKSEFKDYDRKTDGRLIDYLNTSVDRQGVEYNNFLGRIDDNERDRSIIEIEKKLNDIAGEIERTSPTIDYKDLCERFMEMLEKYETNKRQMKEVKARRANALMGLFDTIDYLSKIESTDEDMI